MIVTVTPNPSIDRTLFVGELRRGTIVRSAYTVLHPSGKGVNVARALTANGMDAEAMLPLGGYEGQQLARMLAEEGIRFVATPMDGTVRVNVSVVEEDGTVTKLNERGPSLSPDEVAALMEATINAAQDADWLVGSGSLPDGAGDLYLSLVDRAHEIGLPIAIDTQGHHLPAVASRGADLVKPNLRELSAATCRHPTTLGEAAQAASDLADAGARCVLASLGSEGALLVQDGRIWHGEANPGVVRSTVGAGDALLAGFLSAKARGPEALATGLAWAAAACRLSDSDVPRSEDINKEEVIIHTHLNVDRPLIVLPTSPPRPGSATKD